MTAPVITTDTATSIDIIGTIDARLDFLQRASARLALVEAGEMDLETAIAGLIEPFEALVGPLLCGCSRDIIAGWERQYPPIKNKRSPTPRPTPKSTIEAVLHSVRARGIAALKEPANRERLSRCDRAARAEINKRISNITKEIA
jgi:hypothetical protein